MQETIHLVPKALKDKLAAHAKAAADAAAKGKPPPPDLVITDADFGSMSGRVVTLRELSIVQIERTDSVGLRQFIRDACSSVGELETRKQRARLRAMIVGVSEPKIDPRARMKAKVLPVTEADLEGVSMLPGEEGVGKSTGRSFEELFTSKDQNLLRVWDQKHHVLSDADIEDILGEAIPTTDD